MSADDPRHGTTRGFHAGCRLECCRRAFARYEKAKKVRKYQGITWQIPAQGAQRRIQALMALGWTSLEIAEECGWTHRNYVLRILSGQKGKPCTWVQRKTHQTIADAYERMCMKIPPASPFRSRDRRRALRKGYAPPLAWDDIDNDEAPVGHVDHSGVDYAAVERLLAGDLVPHARAERWETIRRWDGSDAELERRFGWNVARDRRRMREQQSEVAA